MNNITIKYKGNIGNAEIDLEKAINKLKSDRENKELADEVLKKQKDIVDLIVQDAFESMINDIAKIIVPN